MRVEQIRCDQISPDTRSDGYWPEDIELLANSIRLNGVLRPVLLRATAEGYSIVHGERRWRAALMAGLDRIPAILVDDFAHDRDSRQREAAADAVPL